MNNEQLQIAAKEFCDSIDIRELYRLTDSREKPYELLVVFAQSLIDKGEMVDKHVYDKAVSALEITINSRTTQKKRADELQKQIDQSNTPQSGEVKSLQKCKDDVAKLHGQNDWDYLCFVWAGFIKQVEPFMNEAGSRNVRRST